MYKAEILNPLNKEDAINYMKKIGTDEEGIKIMAEKMQSVYIRLKDINIKVALILKQEMLSEGGECAVSKETITLKNNTTDAILIGNMKIYKNLIEKLKKFDYFNLQDLARYIQDLIENYYSRPILLLPNNKSIQFNRTYIMGILNITPDSFYDGGKYIKIKSAQKKVEDMLKEGADIIDVGGESTRPGSTPVPQEIELKRILPILSFIKKNFKDVILSVDTYKSGVAERALDIGADIINDISGLRFDKRLAEVVSKYRACIVINHIQNTPKNMQDNPEYKDILIEILDYLKEGIDIAQAAGILPERIIVDPGIGFGKTTLHNLNIIKRLQTLKILKKPILIGVSRKRFIGDILKEDVHERLEGSLAAALLSMQLGANILRTHDVGATKKATTLASTIINAEIL